MSVPSVRIEPVRVSRASEFDLTNVAFSRIFSDHML
jgi:hypothetical protein